MHFVCKESVLNGDVTIPGSKSHTIRAVTIAALADGKSTLYGPLHSEDTLSAVKAATALGADVQRDADTWRICGLGGPPQQAAGTIDVGNSGTTLRILLGICSLIKCGGVTLTGDAQIRRRPAAQLVGALNDLGADVVAEGDNGCAPFRVNGGLQGGRTTLESPTSQYLTSLLLSCPLAPSETVIDVPILNEKPYVRMTLDWLRQQGVHVDYDAAMTRFRIPGSQRYSSFSNRIPADFSSATFFLGAGALGRNRVGCRGLDLDDSQADRAVVTYLERMGARVEVDASRILVQSAPLHGTTLDLNESPDALPVMAVVAAFASGTTELVNVAHARLKETDRISVMCRELRKMGADIEEREDGLAIRGGGLHAADVHGHGDHRVVMALALAGMNLPGTTTVTTAETAAVTFPTFRDLMKSLGGNIDPVGEAEATC